MPKIFQGFWWPRLPIYIKYPMCKVAIVLVIDCVVAWTVNFYCFVFTGQTFSLRQLGICEPSTHRGLALCPETGLSHPLSSYSRGTVPTENHEPTSPEHTMALWGRGTKSGQSSCLSSRSNSALTLTDTEMDNKSDNEIGESAILFYCFIWCCLFIWGVCFHRLPKGRKARHAENQVKPSENQAWFLLYCGWCPIKGPDWWKQVGTRLVGVVCEDTRMGKGMWIKGMFRWRMWKIIWSRLSGC